LLDGGVRRTLFRGNSPRRALNIMSTLSTETHRTGTGPQSHPGKDSKIVTGAGGGYGDAMPASSDTPSGQLRPIHCFHCGANNFVSADLPAR
jgi:hypothetical protein